MAEERVDSAAGPELAAAVDDAVIGDVLADLPEAQPDRALTSATDISSLYVRHRSGLAAHARRFLRDQRDVDEVVQETFLRLFLAIGEIETELQAIAFARRTLTNLCIDRYRADRRRPMLVNLEAAPVGELAYDGDSDDPVLRAEDAAIVREALARLSPLHRAALVKREIEEKSIPQIAAELDVPEESVKHLLFRARRALRRLLVGTSVQPGVDLTAGEVAAIANRRAAVVLMRGANVFIVLVVGALVAAVGVRSLEGRTSGLDNGLNAGAQSLPTSAVPPTPHRAGSGHHRGGASHHPLVTTPSQSDAPSLPTVHPVQQAPLHPSKGGKPSSSGAAASRGHFKLSGPLHVTGAPQVDPAAPVTADGGVTTTAASDFSAPTSEGTFELAQTVSTSAVEGDSVSVTPSFVVGNAVESPTMTGSTASVTTGANGTVIVSVLASAQPDPSTNAFQLTALSVHLILSPDLSQVLSETVQLNASPPATPSGSTGGVTNGSDTGSGPPTGGQAVTPGVLEISDLSRDDQDGAGSFFTSDGVSA